MIIHLRLEVMILDPLPEMQFKNLIVQTSWYPGIRLKTISYQWPGALHFS